MSDPRAIKQQLAPWSKDPSRYYVNDWTDRLRDQLLAYKVEHPHAPSIPLLKKVGKVWYDDRGMVHVDGIYDTRLASMIAREMTENHFTEYDYDPSMGAFEIDWVKLVDKVPSEVRGTARFFHHKGEEYVVDEEFFIHERWSNRAFRNYSGNVHFESGAWSLQELVLQLIADEIALNESFGMTVSTIKGSCSSLGGIFDAVQNTNESKLENKWEDPKKSWFIEPTFDSFNSKQTVQGEYWGKTESKNRDDVNDSEHINIDDLREDSILHEHFRKDVERKRAIELKLPKSKWTKTEILDACEQYGLSDSEMMIVRGMKLNDLRDKFLMYEGTDITGNEYNVYQQRHTKFWSLDFEKIEKYTSLLPSERW